MSPKLGIENVFPKGARTFVLLSYLMCQIGIEALSNSQSKEYREVV